MNMKKMIDAITKDMNDKLTIFFQTMLMRIKINKRDCYENNIVNNSISYNTE